MQDAVIRELGIKIANLEIENATLKVALAEATKEKEGDE